jgi:RNA polymerase sigma-70 factor (ECF subfamily)
MVKLPLEQQQIILLVALEGMSYDGVSKLVGIPIGTDRSRLSRGRMMLRQMMDTGDTSAPARTGSPAWRPELGRPSVAPRGRP